MDLIVKGSHALSEKSQLLASPVQKKIETDKNMRFVRYIFSTISFHVGTAPKMYNIKKWILFQYS